MRAQWMTSCCHQWWCSFCCPAAMLLGLTDNLFTHCKQTLNASSNLINFVLSIDSQLSRGHCVYFKLQSLCASCLCSFDQPGSISSSDAAKQRRSQNILIIIIIIIMIRSNQGLNERKTWDHSQRADHSSWSTRYKTTRTTITIITNTAVLMLGSYQMKVTGPVWSLCPGSGPPARIGPIDPHDRMMTTSAPPAAPSPCLPPRRCDDREQPAGGAATQLTATVQGSMGPGRTRTHRDPWLITKSLQ